MKIINRLKKFMIIAMLLLLTTFVVGCNKNENIEVSKESEDNDKIKIVATLFPQYDFARAIVGDKGEVTMLLLPGVESHSYEPTPSDILKINNSDLFIYTGKYMEIWADKLISGTSDKKFNVADISEGIELIKPVENHHDHENEHDEDHHHTYDPHIWTNPANAQIIINNILKHITAIDPANTDYYTSNANAYIEKLKELDTSFKQVVSNGKRKKLIFGSRFALLYFTNYYGLEHEAAYNSCSTEVEPSIQIITDLINDIKENNIPVVYCEELVDPKIARSIASETGAEMLVFHSCHNVSKKEFDSGVTYIDLMKQNLINLKKGLN